MDGKQFIFQDLRREYLLKEIRMKDLAEDPYDQFKLWFMEAVESGAIEANAFALATAASDGKPSCRFVLMKHFDENGLYFFTNYESKKGRELENNPYAAAAFWWGNMERQVRIEGYVKKVERSVSESYFAKRPRSGQLGAWASHQGKVLRSKEELQEAYDTASRQFSDGEISCPPYWGGYLIVPDSFEFWQGSAARLHDRFVYAKDDQEKWTIMRLAP